MDIFFTGTLSSNVELIFFPLLVLLCLAIYFTPKPPPRSLESHIIWKGVLSLGIETSTIPITLEFPELGIGLFIASSAHLVLLGRVAKLAYDKFDREVYLLFGLVFPTCILACYYSLLSRGFLVQITCCFAAVLCVLNDVKLISMVMAESKQKQMHQRLTILVLFAPVSAILYLLLLLLPILIRGPISGNQLRYEAVMLHFTFILLALLGRLSSYLKRINMKGFSFIATLSIVTILSFCLIQYLSSFLAPDASPLGALSYVEEMVFGHFLPV